MKLTIAGGVSLAMFLAVPADPAEPQGKAVYEDTCKQCHGPEGKGDAMADKFYQVRIPRLNSDYVQNKTDGEIREIITRGRRKMAPVRAGRPSVEHRLDPKSVDAVIAYIRTLKK